MTVTFVFFFQIFSRTLIYHIDDLSTHIGKCEQRKKKIAFTRVRSLYQGFGMYFLKILVTVWRYGLVVMIRPPIGVHFLVGTLGGVAVAFPASRGRTRP